MKNRFFFASILFILFFLILLITIFYYKNSFFQPQIISSELLENSISPNLEESTINPELGILITQAKHLNSTKGFISNIYEYVNQTDNITYTIPKNHYARAYFERNLTSGNVIDIFVQNINPATIEIYEKDSDIVIGRIENTLYGWYYAEVNFTGTQNVFDLKSVGNDIVYDYIHDANELLETVNITTSPIYPMVLSTGQSFDMSCDYDMSTAGKGISETINMRWQENSTGVWKNITVNGPAVLNISGETNPQDYTTQENTWFTRTIYANTIGTYGVRCQGLETSPDITGPFQSTTATITVQAPDETFPLIKIVYPSNNTNTTDNTIDINYTRSDTNLASCWYSNDSWTVNKSLGTGGVCTNITAVTWSEDQHNVIIWVNDTAGNTNSSSVRFTVDSTAPFLSIVYPLNNTNTTNTNLNVNYTVSDGLSFSCWYSNDTFDVNTSLGTGGVCSNITTVTWSEDQHNVIIWVNDSAGNTNSSSVRFTVDTTYPLVSIVYPSNNTNTTDNTININYTKSDTNLQSCWYSNDTFEVNTSLMVGGVCTNITAVTWSEDQHNVIIWVNDTAGNTNSSSVRFTVDSTAPFLSIVYPPNNTNTTDNTIDINYTVSDGLSFSCWYSNDTFEVNTSLGTGGVCSNITTVTWSEDQHNVIIWVNDSAGNTNSSSVRFTVDTTYPLVSIVSPANNTNTTDNTININYTKSDTNLQSCWYSNDTFDVNTSLMVNDVCTNITAVTWSEDQHNVIIWVNDTAGNTNSSSVRFTVDSTAPFLSIVYPLNNTNTTNTNLNVNYTVSDGLSFSCWYSNDTFDVNTSLGTGGSCVNITTITWSEDQHNVIVWVNDTAGNTNSSSVRFTIDLTAPTWTDLAKNKTNIIQNDYIKFNASWTDEIELGGFIFIINQTGEWVNSSYFPMTGKTNISENVTQITAITGTNVSWYFWANDSLGNSNKTDIKYFVVVPANTCTYPGTGNWNLNCADDCVFDTTQTIANQNNVTITGTGTLTFNSGGKWSFTGTNQQITIESGCTLNINPGGGWNY